MGFEALHLLGQGRTIWNAGLRYYHSDPSTYSFYLSEAGEVLLGYTFKPTKKTTYQTDFRLQATEMGIMSVVSAGVEYTLTSGIFRAVMNSSGRVTLSSTEYMGNLPVALSIAADLDCGATDYHCGVGLQFIK